MENKSSIYLLHVYNPVIRYFSEDYFLNDPELDDKVPLSFLSHKEVYEESVRKAVIAFKKIRHLQDTGKDGIDNYM